MPAFLVCACRDALHRVPILASPIGAQHCCAQTESKYLSLRPSRLPAVPAQRAPGASKPKSSVARSLMWYDSRLLFAQICIRLDHTPACSLAGLSREFQVCARTISKYRYTHDRRRKFSSFKDDILIARLTRLFLARPFSPVKELSFDLGYKCSRTFARAVRRACGVSAAELRKRIVSEAAAQKTPSATKPFPTPRPSPSGSRSWIKPRSPCARNIPCPSSC